MLRIGLDWIGLDGISPDRSISRSPSGDKNVIMMIVDDFDHLIINI